jgi:hypothetical protein
MLLVACASPRQATSLDTSLAAESVSPEPKGSKSFAGMWLGNAEEGGVHVLGMVAGPAVIAGLRWGDRIIRIDDVEVDASSAREIMASSAPGAQLSLYLMRGDTPLQIELEIGARKQWSGPAAYRAAVPYAATRLRNAAQLSSPVMKQALAEKPEVIPISQRLDRMFVEMARDDGGYHKLPIIRAALMQPGSMTNWRETLLTQMRVRVAGRGPIV